MSAYPFSVFKKANRNFYQVSFKDAEGKYLPPLSTKKKTEEEAREVAFKWLRDGIPQKSVKSQEQEAIRVNDLSLREIIRKLKNHDEVETVLGELKRMGWMKSYILNETPQAQDFIAFLKSFWDWDTSPYIKEKLRKNHGIHKRHCKLQGQAISLYWEGYFMGCSLGDIKAEDIDAFINYMADKDVSASRKNAVIKAGTKALRWAFSKGKIEQDPTRGHLLFSGDESKRNILSPSVAAALFRAQWYDARSKLGNMLAAVTGMRSGEIIALRLQDLGPNCLYVRSSWNREDGTKPPKNNETRTVEIPFPDLINGLFELAKQNPWGVSPESYVFWTEYRKDRPMQGYIFNRGLRRALKEIGFSKDEAAKYLFHGWRHFYTSYMIKKLDKKLLKSQTGHRTDEMLAHYGDHETDGDRELIQTTSKETFAGLLPEWSKMLVFKKEPYVEAVG